MNNLEEIAHLVNQLVRAVKAALPPTAHDSIGDVREALLRDQPTPTPGQLHQMESIDRGKKVSKRNRDYQKICYLGYVGERQDGTLCLTRIGLSVLQYHKGDRPSERD